jgi:hypothetical protein
MLVGPNRREFITGIASAIAWPIAAGAQDQSRIYRLGVITVAPRDAQRVAAFFDELRVLGFVEGQNLMVDGGGFGLRSDQFAEVAAAMAKISPDVVFTAWDPATQIALQAMPNVLLLVCLIWSQA